MAVTAVKTPRYHRGMPTEALDNPFWSSLRTRHRDTALFADDVARYPADFAPFLGVAHAHARVDDALAALVAPGESVYLLGVLPKVPRGWRCEAFRPRAQMTCPRALQGADGAARSDTRPYEHLSRMHIT